MGLSVENEDNGTCSTALVYMPDSRSAKVKFSSFVDPTKNIHPPPSRALNKSREIKTLDSWWGTWLPSTQPEGSSSCESFQRWLFYYGVNDDYKDDNYEDGDDDDEDDMAPLACPYHIDEEAEEGEALQLSEQEILQEKYLEEILAEYIGRKYLKGVMAGNIERIYWEEMIGGSIERKY